MSTISAGNTITTAITITGDTTGNLALTPFTGRNVILGGPLQFSDGSTQAAAANVANITSAGNVTITASGGIINAQTTTGYLILPTGNTAQRPANAVAGTLRYNTTEAFIETFTASGWRKIVPVAFDYLIQYLIVAGGGSAGTNTGGGGAGGYLAASNITVNPGTAYTITVGAGASDGGSRGSNSSISGFTVAVGGGAGGGGSGGSGGGGSGAATSGQGNNGGANAQYGTGGGGGAGAVGNGASQFSGGSGGAGAASSITGTSVTRAGGGGGSGNFGGSGAGGGSGGGGSGGNNDGQAPSAGSANTGGGGGSRGGSGGGSTAGGSGVVILSIPTASYTGTITGGPTVTTSGSNTILVFNSSGSYTA